MNNIIIHSGNRVKVSAAHDIAADLVSRGYRKLTPWWVDGFEQEGLLPIDEVDETAEGVEECFLKEAKKADFPGEVDTFPPWWVDGFKRTGLLPIDEIDETAEGVEECFMEERKKVDFAGEVDTFQGVDLLGGGKLTYRLRIRV